MLSFDECCTHCRKSALQDFGKVPVTDTVGFGENFIFYGSVFLKPLTILKLPFCFGQLFFEEGCNVLITLQYFFDVVTAERADRKVSESPKISLNYFCI